MYIHLHIYMCIYMYVCVCIYTYTHIYIHSYTYIFIQMYIHTYLGVCVYLRQLLKKTITISVNIVSFLRMNLRSHLQHKPSLASVNSRPQSGLVRPALHLRPLPFVTRMSTKRQAIHRSGPTGDMLPGSLRQAVSFFFFFY